MSETSIEWTDRTWNPLRGCSRTSPGCDRCYAEKIAGRFSGPGKPFEGVAVMTPNGARWTGKIKLVEAALLEPLSWRKPQRVFVNSMSDLFHEDVPDAFIDKVFAVMALAPRHTFQILTKRAERMRQYFSVQADDLLCRWAEASFTFEAPLDAAAREALRDGMDHDTVEILNAERTWSDLRNGDVPLPNVWLGVSVENQQYADERIPHLLYTPAAVRFLSCEPLLGPIHFWNCDYTRRGGQRVLGNQHTEIHWLIVGGESGPSARPFDIAWARDIVSTCQKTGTPVFVKQLGSNPFSVHVTDKDGRFIGGAEMPGIHDRKGGDPSEWPNDLRVREFPAVRQ